MGRRPIQASRDTDLAVLGFPQAPLLLQFTTEGDAYIVGQTRRHRLFDRSHGQWCERRYVQRE